MGFSQLKDRLGDLTFKSHRLLKSASPDECPKWVSQQLMSGWSKLVSTSEHQTLSLCFSTDNRTRSSHENRPGCKRYRSGQEDDEASFYHVLNTVEWVPQFRKNPHITEFLQSLIIYLGMDSKSYYILVRYHNII